MAQAFDPERGQLKGDAHPVAERVASDYFGRGFFDVSENGVLIYQGGDSQEEKRITWFDRAGKELSAGESGSYEILRLSPDGAKLAFDASDRAVISGWTNWRGVSTCASQTDPGTDYGPGLVAGRKPDSVRCSRGQGSVGHLPEEFQRGRRRGAAAAGGDLRPIVMAHELVSGWQVHPLRARIPPNRAIQYSGSCLSPATANPGSLSKTPLMGNSLLTADGWRIPPWNPANFRFTLCRSTPLRF